MGNHEEESKMGVTNLASIFALIFFGTPVTLDPLVFVKESKKRTAMLEFLLVLYTELTTCSTLAMLVSHPWWPLGHCSASPPQFLEESASLCSFPQRVWAISM